VPVTVVCTKINMGWKGLNLCQHGTNASLCPDFVVKNDMSVARISYINGVITGHLTF